MVDDLFEISGDGEGGEDGDEPADATVVLHVHVQPGAGRTAVVGRHGDARRRCGSPRPRRRAGPTRRAPTLLAETFGVKAAQVELVGGASSRAKRFRINGVELDGFRRRLEQVVEEGKAGPGPEVRQGMR